MEHFIEISHLDGLLDPYYDIGKFIGTPEHIVIEVAHMAELVEAISAARDRVITSSEKPLVDKLLKLASKVPEIRQDIFGVLTKEAAASSSPMIRFFNALVSKGSAEMGPIDSFPTEHPYNLELDTGSYFQEAGRLLRALSDKLYETSDPHHPEMARMLGKIASNLYMGLVSYGKLRRLIRQRTHHEI